MVSLPRPARTGRGNRTPSSRRQVCQIRACKAAWVPCHRQRPPRKGRRRDTRRPSSDVCRAASFWAFLTGQSRSERETGGQIGERKNRAQLRVRLTCSSTAVGNEECVGFRPFTRRHRKTSCSSSLRGLSPSRGCGAATSTSPGPAATACAMRHAPGFAERGVGWILVAGDADLSGPLRQR